MLFAFGTQQMFAQSSMFHSTERFCRSFDGGDRHGEVPEDPEDPEDPEIPIGSGVAVLIGCAAFYAYTRRKKEK